MSVCTFALGATILIGIECLGAGDDDLIGATCTAALKPAQLAVDGYTVPPSTTAIAATFTPTYRAYDPNMGPGWDLTIDPATSAGLAAGTYVSNAVLTLASGLVVKTAPLFIILEAATA